MNTKSPPTAKHVRRNSVGRMLNLLSRRLNSEMSERLSGVGLTQNGFFILMNLLEAEGQTQSELGKRIELPPYGMTRLIDSLQEQGLVERREDPNSRRNHHIYLTDAGHAIAPKVFTIVQGVNERLLDRLEPAERQAFADTLAKIL